MAHRDYKYTLSSQKDNLRPLKLKIYVDGEDLLKQEYIQHINKHNSKVLLNGHPDAGFDLLFPQEEIINEEGISLFSHKLDLNISAALYEERKECITMHNTLGLSIFWYIICLL